MKIKRNNQHLDNIFCDLGISRGQFFDCYFGSQKLNLYSEKYGTEPYPGAPLTYFTDGWGGRNFFGSEILSKRDFLGSIKDAGIFWFVKKTQSGILGKYVLFNSSNQQ